MMVVKTAQKSKLLEGLGLHLASNALHGGRDIETQQLTVGTKMSSHYSIAKAVQQT